MEHDSWVLRKLGAQCFYRFLTKSNISFQETDEIIHDKLLRSIKGPFWEGKHTACGALLEFYLSRPAMFNVDGVVMVVTQLSFGSDQHKKALAQLIENVLIPKFWHKLSSAQQETYKEKLLKSSFLSENLIVQNL